jgi:hypothetical protein
MHGIDGVLAYPSDGITLARMESTMEYLQRKLKEAGADEWESIAKNVAKELGGPKPKVTFHTLRKIYYGERPNLGTAKADALRAYFQKREKARA